MPITNFNNLKCLTIITKLFPILFQSEKYIFPFKTVLVNNKKINNITYLW